MSLPEEFFSGGRRAVAAATTQSRPPHLAFCSPATPTVALQLSTLQVSAEALGVHGEQLEGDPMEVCSEHAVPPAEPTGERRTYSHRSVAGTSDVRSDRVLHRGLWARWPACPWERLALRGLLWAGAGGWLFPVPLGNVPAADSAFGSSQHGVQSTAPLPPNWARKDLGHRVPLSSINCVLFGVKLTQI